MMQKSTSVKTHHHEFREVTPFYMQHSYSHFRFDPAYDSAKQSNTSNQTNKSEKPVYTRRNSLKDRKIQLNSPRTNSPRQTTTRRSSWSHEPNQIRQFSSNMVKEKKSSSLDENINLWHLRSLTLSDISKPKINEEELGNKTNSTETLVNADTKKVIQLPPILKTHSYQDPVKVQLLKRLVQNRVSNGSTIADLVDEPFFEDVLDICDRVDFFPACRDEGDGLSFETYRALRKCNYLRVSEKNVKSLKEQTLVDLKDGRVK